MARGWESKSIEAQQEDAAAKRTLEPALSAEEAARRTQRATLMLARTRLRQFDAVLRQQQTDNRQRHPMHFPAAIRVQAPEDPQSNRFRKSQQHVVSLLCCQQSNVRANIRGLPSRRYNVMSTARTGRPLTC